MRVRATRGFAYTWNWKGNWHGEPTSMSTTTRLTFEEFEKLPEQEGTHYELDEGELVMEPSPTYFHNVVRGRIAQRLAEFVDAHHRSSATERKQFLCDVVSA